MPPVPHRVARTSGLVVVFVLIVARGAASTPEPGASRDRTPGQVRSTNNEVMARVAQGVIRSITFAGLVDCVADAGVVVYVSRAPNLRKLMNGALQLVVGGTGPVRYLQVVIRPGLPANLEIVTIAHELAHVCEASRAGAVRSTRDLVGYFRDHAVQMTHSSRREFETEAGTLAAAAVRDELSRRPLLRVQR